jgi:penicillin-binding protein 1A
MIEKKYSKEEIIRLYLNTVPFGDNVYGVATASRHYFDKPIHDLELHQHALLVGILKGNSLYHPRRHAEAAKARRNTVLSLVKSEGYIDEPAFKQWASKDLDVSASSPDAYPILGYALEAIKAEAKVILGDSFDIYRDGLTIVSTIDANASMRYHETMTAHLHRAQSRINTNPPSPGTKARLVKQLRETPPYNSLPQKAYDEILSRKRSRTVINHLGETEQITGTPLDSMMHQYTLLKSGAMAIDVNSSAVRLYVGGHHARLHPYDHVRVNRQVASTFKPIIALTALNQGVSPCEYFPNAIPDTAIDLGWLPQNADRSDSGFYSLQGALTHSMNLPFLHLGFQLGISEVIDQAQRMGWRQPLRPDPSILLGSAENNVWEMTLLYGRLQNNILATPYFVEFIYDQDGNVIYERTPAAAELSGTKTAEADTLLGMLKRVTTTGTAKGLHGDWAAKTGTSNRGSDSWTFGCNDAYAFGVWVGGSSPGVITGGSSTTLALPLGIEISRIFTGGHVESHQIVCEDFIEELPEETRGFFDFLKRKKDKPKKKSKKNLLQRLFGK